ncbi:MAG: Replicative DNA helicase [Elusimicrobia bacterium ADurb.Bin231]|nr:MAG: Replicative DNA helicase [Elusimicrobia bacterium ADurb.Bin231]
MIKNGAVVGNIINELIPPHNLDAEKAVLGSMLIEKEAVESALNLLSENDFYLTAHKIIFGEIIKAYDKNKGDVDIVLVSNALKNEPLINNEGGLAYLTGLVEGVVTAAHIEPYAAIVKEKAVLRELIAAGRNIIADATAGKIEDINEVVDRSSQRIFEISQKRNNKNLVWIGDMINSSLADIEKLYKNKGQTPGVPSGFVDLDEITGGFRNGSLNIIAGRPGTGKTSLCLNIAENAAIQHKRKVLIFSLEMSKEELFNRFLCSQARISTEKVRNAYISKEDWPRLTTAAGKLSEVDIFMDDSSSLSVLEMKAKSRRLEAEKGLDLIIIDYLQLMPGKTGRADIRQQEIADISRSLKVMAKDLKLPVVALSQLSREPEKRTGAHAGRPKLADLRESGAIEQDADLVLMIYRPDMYVSNPDSITAESPVSDTEIIIAKNRHGRVGTRILRFHKEYTRFENASRNI